ncbi:MAG: hypothetical protein C0483_13920 [Pirellula sp.]|nr:hypothetical protein [Pirellula sp.]
MIRRIDVEKLSQPCPAQAASSLPTQVETSQFFNDLFAFGRAGRSTTVSAGMWRRAAGSLHAGTFGSGRGSYSRLAAGRIGPARRPNRDHRFAAISAVPSGTLILKAPPGRGNLAALDRTNQSIRQHRSPRRGFSFSTGSLRQISLLKSRRRGEPVRPFALHFQPAPTFRGEHEMNRHSSRCFAPARTVGLMILFASTFIGSSATAADDDDKPAASKAPVSKSPIIATLNVDQIFKVMHDEGYAVEKSEDGFVKWKIEGLKTVMFVAKDSKSIQFYASFTDGNATLKKVNEWNKNKKYSRSYLNDDGEPCLELDLDLEGGVTEARIVDFLSTCRISLDGWYNDVVK